MLEQLYRHSSESTAHALIAFYGKNEQSTTAQRRKSTRNGALERSCALRISQACKLLHVRGQAADFALQLQKAQEEIAAALPKASATEGPQRTSLLLMRHTASIIQKHAEPAAVVEEVQSMRQTIASELYDQLQAYNKPRGRRLRTAAQREARSNRRGVITELASLGLGLRRFNAQQLATPALWHFDNSDNSTANFDSLYIEARPQEPTDYYRVQTKAGCIGVCDNPRTSEYANLKQLRPKYKSNIRLLSGHCDLGFRYDNEPAADNIQFPLGNLIIKETLGVPTAEELDQLDVATDHLFATLKEDKTRRGTAGRTMTYEQSVTA